MTIEDIVERLENKVDKLQERVEELERIVDNQAYDIRQLEYKVER